MEATSSELKRVIDYLEILGDKEEAELCALLHKDSAEGARLLVAIGSLATKACGNLNKLYEMVTTLELCAERDAEKYEIRHVKHEYGADVLITNKETLQEEGIEVKHSMVLKEDRYKTSWNFTVDRAQQLAYQRDKSDAKLAVLIESLYRRQFNGVSYLAVRYGKELLQRYEISGAFIALYCAKKLISASCNNINLGCQRCETCKEYHRIVHIRSWGLELDRRIQASGESFRYALDYFTEDEWLVIVKIVPSKCKVRK